MNATPPRKPLTQSRALYCLVINQCATPGLGSILARRHVAGYGQLLVALTGFTLFVSWYVLLFIKQYQLANDMPVDENTRPLLVELGGAIFVLAWIWSWFTSISIMREAKQNSEQELKAPPLLK